MNVILNHNPVLSKPSRNCNAKTENLVFTLPRFFAGRFATMMFGLPAACLAMYHCTPLNKRKLVGGLFLGAAITSFITGITEPIEFMFLFVAPWLYGVHAFFDGLSFLVADLLNISKIGRAHV